MRCRKSNYKIIRKLKSFMKWYFTKSLLTNTRIDVIFIKQKYRLIVTKKPEMKQIFRILIRMLKKITCYLSLIKALFFILQSLIKKNLLAYLFLKFDMEEFFEIHGFLMTENLVNYFFDYNLKDKLQFRVKYKLVLIISNVCLVFFVRDFNIN